MTAAFLVSGVRTPIGRYGGALAGVRPDDLAAHVIRELVGRHPSVDWAAVDDVLLGCANQAGEDNRNVARMAALLGGLPEGVPGSTVNRLCGSGLDALASAARSIVAGEANLVVAGGVESMSRAPFVMPKAATAWSRSAEVFDTTLGWRFVNPVMRSGWGIDSMPETAENVAAEFGVDRSAQDEFALRSQQRAAKAQADGRLAEEIAPVTVPAGRHGSTLVDRDEHPRETTLEKLSALPTPFRDGGTVTAGTSSGVNAGAVALLVAML
ncbi:acetyl-CoA C-acyltransferase, partial [Micromonospora zhanjiangensis]